MNILIPHSWLTEFVKTDASPREIARLLSLHSASVERLTKQGDDWIYDIEITTNRVDMASVVGMAREVFVVLNQNNSKAEFKPLTVSEPKHLQDRLPITIKNDPKLCRRVLGIVIDAVKIGPSPDWMWKRLEKSGIRSLNNLIDITNYVMLETGHPMHVFDYDRIGTNTLIIRPSKKGEKITSFEGKDYELPGDDITIDDGTGEIIDLPGIAGTKNSVVTNETKRILLFTENNDAHRIRRTCMNLGIHTYASNINKNRPDPEIAYTAFLRGIHLYQSIANGSVASRIVDQYQKPDKPAAISLPLDRLTTYMGTEVDIPRIESILTPLGFSVSHHHAKSSIAVTPPSWRQDDVLRPEDIIEEIARIYGYYRIAPRMTIGTPVQDQTRLSRKWTHMAKHALKYWGFTELYTSSLISKDLLKTYGFDPEQSISLKNPLTEEGECLRPSLVPGIMQAIEENITRNDTLNLFELSRVYRPQRTDNQPIAEPTMLTVALNEPDPKQAFYKAKGIVEAMCSELQITNDELRVVNNDSMPISHLLHPKRKGQLLVGNQPIGIIGQINDTVIVDIDFDELINHATAKKTYTPIPEHPPIIEDMTMTVKPETYIGSVIEKITRSSSLVAKVELAGRFRNNVTFRITFQHPKRNLTDEEVGEIKKKIAV